MFKFDYHENPSAFAVGELPYHSYFIPFSNELDTSTSRTNSEYYTDLCKNWHFAWFRNPYQIPENFLEEGMSAETWKMIDLPECWQMHGDDWAEYQTSIYPFPYQPPMIPKNNPCAVYMKDFTFSPILGKRYEYHIEGKASCVYLFVNGKFVGFGQVPHNESAFDVTEYLKSGKNRFVMVVMKWCAGSYLDDQDMIRLNGIFRDVYLLCRNQKGVRDFRVQAGIDGILHLSVQAEAETEAVLFDADGRVVATGRGNCQNMKVPNAILWNTEMPYCYRLMLHCADEYIRQDVGFREIHVQNGVFAINGKPVKLLGVNRHDSSAEHGYAVTPEEMERDIVLMKQNNMNTIRTSHYPNSSLFYELCNRYGMYVVCEADLETHGAADIGKWDDIVSMSDYHEAVADRIHRMYHAYINQPCIVMWSLGNESCWGNNLADAARWAKTTDSTRPIHYESIIHRPHPNEEKANLEPELLDVWSGMYCSIQSLSELPEKETRPIFQCEYTHAMGNSCGDVSQYCDLFFSSEQYMGGCVWEWCDHTVRQTDADGTTWNGYGGDFSNRNHCDYVNGGSFCMDGLVSPERAPHSALLEVKQAYAPVVFLNFDGTGIAVQNRNYFSDTSQYLFDWKLERDGVQISAGTFECQIPPQQCKQVELFKPTAFSGNCYLTVFARLKESTSWCKPNHEICFRQFQLHTEPVEKPSPYLPEKMTVCEKEDRISVIAGNFRYSFDRVTGMLTEWKKNDADILQSPASLSCWRAPIDNDKACFGTHYANAWEKDNRYGALRWAMTDCSEMTVAIFDGGVTVSARILLSGIGRKPAFRGYVTYHIYENGCMEMSLSGTVEKELPFWLARIGFLLPINPTLNQVRYYGRGERENYPDKRFLARVGLFESTADGLSEYYEKPQSNGNHMDCRRLTLYGAEAEIKVTGDSFAFSISPYSDEQMANAPHAKMLKKEQALYLHLDGRVSGIGSASCGLNLIPSQYCICAGENIDFNVYLG